MRGNEGNQFFLGEFSRESYLILAPATLMLEKMGKKMDEIGKFHYKITRFINIWVKVSNSRWFYGWIYTHRWFYSFFSLPVFIPGCVSLYPRENKTNWLSEGHRNRLFYVIDKRFNCLIADMFQNALTLPPHTDEISSCLLFPNSSLVAVHPIQNRVVQRFYLIFSELTGYFTPLKELFKD